MSAQKQAGEQMKIRLQTPLHDWVKAQATEQERPMNWVINKLIEEAKTRAETLQQGAAA
jgi:hypothetical protein